jgi:branched-chain amino acid transport system substrate-binding protein
MTTVPRLILYTFAALVLALGVAACGDDDDSDSGSGSDAESGEQITFGASLSLTGDLAAEARTVRDGYDFIVDEINRRGGIPIGDRKHKIAIKYYDDKSDADTAVRLFERLVVQDKVDFLLGPYSSGITEAASTVAERHRKPMVVAHAASTNIYERGFKNLFGTLTTVDSYSKALLEAAQQVEPTPKRVALINENALFPQTGIEAAERQAKEMGFEVVYKGTYPSGTSDLSSLVSAAKRRNPDMLMAAGYTGDMIQLVRQAKEARFEPDMMSFLLGPTVKGFIEDLKDDANFMFEPVQWTPDQPTKDQILGWTAEDYAKRFEEAKGYTPDYHPPQSSAAVEVFYNALQKAGTLDPAKVRDAIAESELESFYGRIKFNEKGQNVAKGMTVIQVQDGKPQVVYPDDAKQAEPVVPMPSWRSR